MKTRGIFIIFGLLFISSLTSVSAYSASYYGNFVADTMNRAITLVQDFLGPIFSALLGVGNFDEFFFSRILLLIILFSIIYISLKATPIFADAKNKWALFVVTSVVSLLAVRFMAESSLIQMALLPYGTLGVSLSIFLPFLIFFWFLHSAIPDSTLGRRLGWGLFAAVFFGLWINRADQFGDYNWVYWIGIVGVGIAFVFDSKLHEYFGLSELRKLKKLSFDQQIANVEADLAKYNAIPAPRNPSTEALIKSLEKRRDDLIRRKHKI